MRKRKPKKLAIRLTGEVKPLNQTAICICRSFPAKYLADTSSGSLYLCEPCLQKAKSQARLPELAPNKGSYNPTDAMFHRSSGSAFSGKRR